MVYDHKKIEEKWALKWLENKTYQPDLKKAKNPYYNLMMFPYPSAEGLHVGNMFTFTGADIFGRYQRMKGYDVFEPIGLDGFGIHSENYAIKMGVHPAEQAEVSQDRFYDQLSKIGAGYAWDNRLETYDPEYYKWTQWIFTKMFEHGLAYRKAARVNWCPSCKTVLADEQVEDGKCERCKSEVERKVTKQWFFKITEYADRLLDNIGKIDWSYKIKIAQTNWIGRKEGINITYPIFETDGFIECFTTRPETNFGATFVVIAPEHELVNKILSGVINIPEKTKKELSEYVEKSLKKTEQQRKEEEKDKTGVNLNLFAVNRLNETKLPIFVSDFVLKDYGSGAVVGVPGHDERDFEFTQKFDLPVIRVVESDGDKSEINSLEKVFVGEGIMMNSSFLDGLETKAAIEKISDYLEEKGWGKRVVTYHLRDWLISRQRYWGPPIPMVFCETCAKAGLGKDKEMLGWYAVEEKDLPVILPELSDYKPTGDGKAPLEKASEEFLYTTCPNCGGRAKRETDVSDTFLDSSWYFLRYPSVGAEKADKSIFDLELTEKWLPVSTYIGGAEHAVLHLLYSRFVWMVLSDWGYIPKSLGDEPFPYLFSHGLIVKDGAKMSKSKGNVIIPDEYIEKYGADTFRMYLMFLGSYDQGGDFRDTGIAGMHRFLSRVWQIIYQNLKEIEANEGIETTAKLESKLHETIKKMTEDLNSFKFNTAIAALMELVNVWREEGEKMSKSDLSLVVRMISPIVPFMSEEIWQTMNQKGEADGGNEAFESVHLEKYPVFNAQRIVSLGVLVVIQVNGKKRAEMMVDKEMASDKEQILKKAKELEEMEKWISEGVKKEIFVTRNDQILVNFVM